jgi:hypothetical protein
VGEKICRSVWGMKVDGGLLCSLLPGSGGEMGGGDKFQIIVYCRHIYNTYTLLYMYAVYLFTQGRRGGELQERRLKGQ